RLPFRRQDVLRGRRRRFEGYPDALPSTEFDNDAGSRQNGALLAEGVGESSAQRHRQRDPDEPHGSLGLFEPGQRRFSWAICRSSGQGGLFHVTFAETCATSSSSFSSFPLAFGFGRS